MKCITHDCEMEWMPCEAHPDSGSWYCEGCWEDEESMFVEDDAEYQENFDEITDIIRNYEP